MSICLESLSLTSSASSRAFLSESGLAYLGLGCCLGFVLGSLVSLFTCEFCTVVSFQDVTLGSHENLVFLPMGVVSMSLSDFHCTQGICLCSADLYTPGFDMHRGHFVVVQYCFH